jgi:hypothetical protein
MEQSTEVSEEPFNRKERGTARVLLNETMAGILDANAHCSSMLNRLIPEVARDHGGNRGVLFTAMLREARHDPTAIPRWRQRNTEPSRQLADALWVFCCLVADEVTTERGADYEMRVYTRPEDEPAENPRDAQKKDTSYADHVIVGQLWQMEADEGPMTREAAKALLSRREGYSIPRINRAILAEYRRMDQRNEEDGAA